MRKITCYLFVSVLFAPLLAFGQAPEIKFIADTLVVQADGRYESDPDLATLAFQVSSQEKELRKAYDAASQSMRHIAELAERNGLKKEDVSMGVLTVAPLYEGDRKRRARSFYVQGQMMLRVRDFSKIGPIMDESVQDGIVDFRSLTYSLADEEAAKQRAVAEGMRRAIGRANIALEQKGQKLGALRYMNLDVRALTGIATLQPWDTLGGVAETVELSAGGGLFSRKKVAPPPPPPLPTARPEKIAVTATVQCAFQIL
jgi:uncharacterized protein YggE